MRKIIYTILTPLFFIAIFLIGGNSVSAADLGLGVQPVLPDNQRSATTAYFDFIAAPKVSTTITVNLTNNSDSEMLVDATVVPAQTSTNGTVSYPDGTPTLLKDNTDISKFVDKPKQSITIPAKGTVAYNAKVTMPSAELSGMIAGAVILKPADQDTSGGSGMTVKSVYQYAITIVARNYDKTWTPELKIEDAEIEQVDYSNLVNVLMENTSSTFLNQLRVEETVSRKDSDEVYKKDTSDMQMAPNTSFKYGVDLPDSVKSGTYEVNLVAYYVKDDAGKFTASDGQKYQYSLNFKKEVTLSSKMAKTFTKKIAAIKTPNKAKTDLTKYFVIGGIVVLVVLIVLLIIFYRRKKRENQALKKELEEARKETK